jgi:translocation and assembly module TamA
MIDMNRPLQPFRESVHCLSAATRPIARVLVLLAGIGSVAAHATTEITGIEDALLANELAYLDVDDLDCSADAFVVARAVDRITEQTNAALNAYGYYAPAVSVTQSRTEECWDVRIAINPGEPVRLRTVDVGIDGAGAANEELESLITAAALAPGDRLEHGRYEMLKRNLRDLARNRGYAQAGFRESRIDVYPEQHVADLTLALDTGPRYSIGTVTLLQDALDPDFVNSFHELRTGTPYDNRLLTQAFLDLNDSGYFADVDVRVLPADPATLTIPIEIELKPAPRRQVSYGLGFSTDTGPRVRFGRTVRRFNERGHQLTLDGQLSPVVSELTSIYRMPFSDPRFDWISFSLGAKREETDTSLARSIEAGVRRVVDRPGDWSRTLFLNFVFEDFEVASQTGRPRLLIPGVDWTRIRGDDALRPTKGSKLSFDLSAANDSLLSDVSFVQLVTQLKWVRTVAEHNRVLLRARGGATKDDNFALLPPSIRFFAGGDQSIRGFDFESLGPVDQNGEVIGGTRLLEFSAEFEHEIKPRWSLATFVDAGNAFNSGSFTLRKGAGFGARWRSPLGPVRIDVAWPINDIEQGPRLHISLGPDL